MATDLQKKLIEVYKEIRSVCEENDIRYFAGYGTAIGAVRHKGIIPWDDDIDIEMPWKDYLRFIKIAQKKLPKHLKVLNGMDAGGVFIFSKVFDTESTFFISQVLRKPKHFTGVYIDIFPVIGAPSGSRKQRDFERKILSLNDELWKARVLDSGEDEQALVDEYVSMCEAYDFDSANYVRGGFAPTSKAPSAIYPRKWYDSYERVPFEDTDIRVPVGYDKLLTTIYGDYMTPPPQEKQVAHMEDSILDLHHSFRDYKDLLSSKDSVVKHFVDFAIRSISEKNISIDNQVREINRLYLEIDTQQGVIDELRAEVDLLKQDILARDETLEAERKKRRDLERSVSGVKGSARHFAKNVKTRLRKKR